MPGKIKHVAIVSSNAQRELDFYKSLFGMKGDPRGERAVSVSDGYVGLNVNPRGPGRQAGLDHFGIEVEDIEAVYEQVQERYPSIKMLRRPSGRSFAGFSMHDPMGQVFDLAPAARTTQSGVYVDLESEQHQPRHVSHLFLRTLDPTSVARFYVDIFGLEEQEKVADDPNHYLSDGTLTLVVAPWQITDYAGAGIERPALDHLGFEVESLEAFHTDLSEMVERSPELAPMPIKGRGEGDARMALLAGCTRGEYRLSDPDGVLLDVEARR
jgi:catechol 2,3-dioxygenase-like lactoylglutathione lyase family enzyme